MNNDRLSRILTHKLETHVSMNTWTLKTIVDDAIKAACINNDELNDFIEQLHERIVRFCYRKNDGTVREAIGTLKPSIVEKLATTKGQKQRSTPNHCVIYYDLEQEDWRCFNEENFIRIIL